MFEDQSQITIRELGAEDGEALARLAERDSSRVPSGTVLGAIAADGILLAALSLETRALVADPFSPSEHAVSLLRTRRRQIRGLARRRPRERHRLRVPRLIGAYRQ